LEGHYDTIEHLINVQRSIQQESYGILLINKQNKVFLVQNEKYYWGFPKGKPKLDEISYEYETKWACALREFKEEINVDLRPFGVRPTEYWETTLKDSRLVGLFVIDNFDEAGIDFKIDGKEIIATAWLDIRNKQHENEVLRKHMSKKSNGSNIKTPYFSAIPFLRHLLVYYLPSKEQQRLDEIFLPPPEASSLPLPPSELLFPSPKPSLFDMLLGRKSPIQPPSPTQTLAEQSKTLLTLLHSKTKEDDEEDEEDEDEDEDDDDNEEQPSSPSVNILGMIKEAFEKAQLPTMIEF